MEQGRLERLERAFALHVVRRIVEADGVVDLDEAMLAERLFPRDELRRLGWLDDRGALSSAWEQALVEALRVLPGELGEGEKLSLVARFHATCMADGELHPREVAILQEAARLLGLDAEQLSRHLDALAGSGEHAPPVRQRQAPRR